MYSLEPFESVDYLSYNGCGATAIYNVLNFFGVTNVSTKKIRDNIRKFEISANEIAMLPSDVRNELNEYLAQRGYGRFSVKRASGKNEGHILSELNAGRIVIALVDGGRHYVVVTGYRLRGYQNGDYIGHEFHIIDYAGRDRWVGDLHLEFSDFSGWAGHIGSTLANTAKYLSGTYIAIEALGSECTEGDRKYGSPCPGNHGDISIHTCANGRWRLTQPKRCTPIGGGGGGGPIYLPNGEDTLYNK